MAGDGAFAVDQPVHATWASESSPRVRCDAGDQTPRDFSLRWASVGIQSGFDGVAEAKEC